VIRKWEIELERKTFVGWRVAPIVDKMRENRLKWFEHVDRTSVDAVNAVVRSDMVKVDGNTKGTVRPKLTVVQKDLGFLEITQHDALDTTLWGQGIQVANPN